MNHMLLNLKGETMAMCLEHMYMGGECPRCASISSTSEVVKKLDAILDYLKKLEMLIQKNGSKNS